MRRIDQLNGRDFFEDDDGHASSGPDLNNVLLSVVRNAKEGAVTNDVRRAAEDMGAKATTSTVLNHLRELEREREVYSRRIGAKGTLIWYPNGRLVHPYLESFLELRDKVYRLTVQEGRSRPLLQIQERSFSLAGGEKIDGAIFIDLDDVEALLQAVQELRNRLDEIAEKP